jgi:hypothetical protein
MNSSRLPQLHDEPTLLSFCSVLIEGIKFYANKPSLIGKTFLRLERDFDKHVNYCRDESNAQEFLFNNDAAREFFEVSYERLSSFLFSLFGKISESVQKNVKNF